MYETQTYVNDANKTWGQLIDEGVSFTFLTPMNNEVVYLPYAEDEYVRVTQMSGPLSPYDTYEKIKTTDELGKYTEYYISGKYIYAITGIGTSGVYTLTVKNGTGGTATYTTKNTNEYEITSHVKNGYTFIGWTISGEYEFLEGDMGSEIIRIKISSNTTVTPSFTK